MTTRREILRLGGALGAVGLVGMRGAPSPLRRPSPRAAWRRKTCRFRTTPSSSGRPSWLPSKPASTTVTPPARCQVRADAEARPGPDGARPHHHPGRVQRHLSGPHHHAVQGTRTEVRIRNDFPPLGLLHPLAFQTVTHLHGSASLPQYDGYANDATAPGFVKNYHYPNWQTGRTLWYHDHKHHVTAQNVYSGLAGFYPLSDRFERAQLPQGQFDVPLMISDALSTPMGRSGTTTMATRASGATSSWSTGCPGPP